MKHHFFDFVRRVKIPDSSPLRSLRSILLLFIMLFGFSQAWAQDSFTITFKENGGSSDGSSQVKTISAIIEDGAEYVSGVSATRVYNACEGRGIKIGTGSNSGTLTLTLDQEYKVSYIDVEAMGYFTKSASETTLNIQNEEFSLYEYDYQDVSFDTYEYTYSESTKISSITIGSVTKRNYIKSMTVYYETVDGIEISGTPTTTTYNEGEAFDPAGLTVQYVYSDGSYEDVDPNDIEWSIYPTTLSVDDVDVTVTATVGSFYSEIYPEVFVKGITGIEIAGTPITDYNDGDTFDPTGLTVNYVYSDNSKEAVSAENIIWTIDGNAIGSYHFTVDDNGVFFNIAAQVDNYTSDDLDVIVSVRGITGIEIVGTPITDYNDGDIFDLTGLTVNYVYSDDSKEAVSAEDITWMHGGNPVDSYHFTVDDNGGYFHIEATVGNYYADIYIPSISVRGITDIEIVGTPITNYNEGELFDITGLTVRYVYNDDSRSNVDANDIIWKVNDVLLNSYHLSVDDDKTNLSVEAYVGDYDKEIEVLVNVKGVYGIEVSGEPDKKIYHEGELFDPTGLIVEYIYTDNTRQTVDPAAVQWEASYYHGGWVYFYAGETKVDVSAYVNPFTSEVYTVTGLTVLPNLEGIELSGTPDKTDYIDGDIFDPAGLVVEYVYSDNSRVAVAPADITWIFEPAILSVNDGSVTVTAQVGEMSDYNNYNVTVTAPAYEKITASQEDWSGEYLLVYENGSTAYVWDGRDAVDSYETATIVSDIIEKPSGAAALIIEAVTGGYSIRIVGDYNNGKYLADNANTAALNFADVASAAAISYEGDWTKILFSQRCIRFNTADQMRFRNYAADKQQPVQLYKRVDNRADSELAWSANSVSLYVGETFNAPTLSYATGFNGVADIVITSDNTSLATVNEGVVSLVANVSGTAVIKAVFAGNDNYRPAVVSYVIHVNKKSPELTWSKYSDEITIGDDWTAPTFENPYNVSVTFETDEESVATVTNDGVISLAGGTGTANINAYFSGNASYYSDQATYTITVNPVMPAIVKFFAPVAWGSDVKVFTWEGSDPGFKTMTSTGNGRWFSCEMEKGIPFLFCTGDWADQTQNIAAVEADKCFTWTANREEGKIVPAEVDNCQMNYAIAGTLPGLGWNVNEFEDLDVYHRIEFNNLPAGTYQFKITNGSWAWNVGYAYADAENSNIELSNKDGNVQFTTSSEMNVTIQYNPATEKITVNGERVFNPNIEFNKTHVVIDGANITTTASDDSNGNIWSIAVEGNNVYHASNQGYEQVGSNANPASKITFTTTLAELPFRAQVSDVTIKLSGNSSTSADVSIKVDNVEIGSGTLNGSDVVLISSDKVAAGQTLSITIDDISSAIKCYGIEYAYETYETVEVKFFAPRDENNKWEHVYAHAWNGHGTQWPGEEITASKQSNWFTYRAEKGASFLFHDNMGMQTVNIDNIQSDVCYVPSAIDFNSNPKMVSLAEQCDVNYYIFGSAALMGGDADWTQGKLLEAGSVTFEDVQPTGDDSLVFKINIGNWFWSIGDSKLNSECASIATAGENNNVQFKTNTKQNITISYDPVTDKICLDAELVKWTGSIGSYEPVEMHVNSIHNLNDVVTVPENSEIHYEITEGTDVISITGNSLDGYKITAHALGTATVRAYIEESALYTAAETYFTVTVTKIPGTVSVANTELFVGGYKTVEPLTNISGYAASDVTYAIESGSEFITVDNSGLVSALVAGTANVRVTIAEQPLYTSATNTFAITVSRHEGEVSAQNMSLKVNEQAAPVFNTNITDYAASDVTYSIQSGSEYVTIVDGQIKGIAAGEAIVRISIAQTAAYTSATNIFHVTVSLNDGSISAENMSLKVNELKTPTYLTTNEGAAISYEVISGAEYAAVVGGQIRGLAAGVATVKISAAATAVYAAAENTFTVTVSLNDGTISAENMSLKVNELKAPTYLTTNEGAAISYEVISGAEYAAVVGGQIRGLAAGVATVKISAAATAVYAAAENTFTVTVSLNDGTISAENMSLKVNELKAPTYLTTNEGAAISYEVISGAEYAAVVGGQIRGLAAGVATVKISAAATAVYAAAENTFTVTVSLNDGYVNVSDLSLKVNEQKVPSYVTSNEGAAVSYEAVSGAEFIEIDNVNGTITGKAKGNAVVKIMVAATGAYEAVENTFNVSVTKYAATVSIENLNLMVGDQIVPEFETNVPGGVANYSFVSGDDCVQIEGTTITCIAAGSAILRISITGNDAYEIPNANFAVNVTAQPEPEQVYDTIREGLQIGRYYTICMPKNIIAVQGATFWTMSKRNAAATLAYLEEEQAPLTAGAPYIFLATAETLEVIYGEETALAPVENGALRGTFDHMYQADFNSVSAANNNSNVYMLVNNVLRIVSGSVSGNHLSPNRAYILEEAFEIVNEAPQSAPGRRVIGMPMRPNTATALDEEMNYDGMNVQKRIIDNQLFIIVGDQMYDATGHLVK